MRRSIGLRAHVGGRRAVPYISPAVLVQRAAIEDIGLADPEAVHQALAAKDVFDFLGSPEGELALAQCVLYLASAPKSNAVYAALGAAKRAAQEHGSLMPPAHILNAPTQADEESGLWRGLDGSIRP